jgi:hypothetical protein
MAAIALRRASSGADESGLVTNSSIFILLWPATISGRPSLRLTLARHLPGLCSKAFTKNCLYSTADPRGVSLLEPRKRALAERDRIKILQPRGCPSGARLARIVGLFDDRDRGGRPPNSSVIEVTARSRGWG